MAEGDGAAVRRSAAPGRRPSSRCPGQHHRRERLVDLEQRRCRRCVRPARASTLRVAGIGAGQHQDRVVAGHGEGVEPGPGPQPELGGPLAARDQHGRRPVGDLRGVAGGDQPADLAGTARRPRAWKAGRSSARPRSGRADPLVRSLGESRRRRADLDRHDLAVEAAPARRPRRPAACDGQPKASRLARGRCPRPAISSAAMPWGTQAVPGSGPERRRRTGRGADRREPIGHAAHRLDAAGDDHVVGAGQDALGGEVRRPAGTSRTGGRRSCAGTSSGKPAASTALRAMLSDCSPTWDTQPVMHVLDLARVDAGPLDEGRSTPARRSTGWTSRQRAARLPLPIGGADRLDDHRLARHGHPSPVPTRHPRSAAAAAAREAACIHATSVSAGTSPAVV